MPGGAEGCFGSIVNLTRPLVAFSTSVAQPCSTTLVRWCWGETHEDIVSVVVCASAGAAVMARTSAEASGQQLGQNDSQRIRHMVSPPGGRGQLSAAVVYRRSGGPGIPLRTPRGRGRRKVPGDPMLKITPIAPFSVEVKFRASGFRPQ